jgi:hypothetical protein
MSKYRTSKSDFHNTAARAAGEDLIKIRKSNLSELKRKSEEMIRVPAEAERSIKTVTGSNRMLPPHQHQAGDQLLFTSSMAF